MIAIAIFVSIGIILAVILGSLAAAGKIGDSSSRIGASPELANAGESATPVVPVPPTRTSSSSASRSATATRCPTSDEIPKDAQGSWLDTTSWKTLDGFNCTFTDELVGGLPIVGLNATWDDSKQANPNVPPLNQSWGAYGPAKPIRGVNLGGWFSLEPFITPSIFDSVGAPDEWNVCVKLGSRAAEVLEEHYATFYTEDDFRQIAAAGLDHVRIPSTLR